MLDYVKNECFTGTYKIDEKYIKTLLEIERYHLNNCKCSLENKIDSDYQIALSGYIEEDNICIKDFIASYNDTEDEAIDNYEVEKIITYLENNFTEKDIDIFKETFGLIDGIPKSRRNLAQKYNIKFQAIDQRYQKTLGKIRENFNI